MTAEGRNAGGLWRAGLVLGALACVSAVSCNQAFAQPIDGSPRYWFLDSLRGEDLNATDWDLLRQNVHLALYELQDGQSVTWADPTTLHSGSIRVEATLSEPGRTCRWLRVSIDVAAGSDDDEFPFCRTDEGFWILTTTPPPKPATATLKP